MDDDCGTTFSMAYRKGNNLVARLYREYVISIASIRVEEEEEEEEEEEDGGCQVDWMEILYIPQ